MGADLRKRCKKCTAVIPAQQGSARPRIYCVVCRPPRDRPNPRLIQLPDSGPAEEPAEAASPLVTTYRQVLEAAGRLATPEGAHVMHLAVLFANGQHTAAGAASLSKELRSAMESALRGAPKQADAVDELDARRRQKAAEA